MRDPRGKSLDGDLAGLEDADPEAEAPRRSPYDDTPYDEVDPDTQDTVQEKVSDAVGPKDPVIAAMERWGRMSGGTAVRPTDGAAVSLAGVRP